MTELETIGGLDNRYSVPTQPAQVGGKWQIWIGVTRLTLGSRMEQISQAFYARTVAMRGWFSASVTLTTLALLVAGCQDSASTNDAGVIHADAHDLHDASAEAPDAMLPCNGVVPCVATIAGNGQAAFVDGSAAAASFYSPDSIVIDDSGRIYVADGLNQALRVIDQGQVATLAGTGISGLADGTAAVAQFYRPLGIALGDAGLYVADRYNHRIRIVAAGTVGTFAGTGPVGIGAGWHQDGPTGDAHFYNPSGVAVDDVRHIVYVADTANRRIRMITDGVVSTLAGTGEAGFADGATGIAKFMSPHGIAVPQWQDSWRPSRFDFSPLG